MHVFLLVDNRYCCSSPQFPSFPLWSAALYTSPSSISPCCWLSPSVVPAGAKQMPSGTPHKLLHDLLYPHHSSVWHPVTCSHPCTPWFLPLHPVLTMLRTVFFLSLLIMLPTPVFSPMLKASSYSSFSAQPIWASDLCVPWPSIPTIFRPHEFSLQCMIMCLEVSTPCKMTFLPSPYDAW